MSTRSYARRSFTPAVRRDRRRLGRGDRPRVEPIRKRAAARPGLAGRRCREPDRGPAGSHRLALEHPPRQPDPGVVVLTVFPSPPGTEAPFKSDRRAVLGAALLYLRRTTLRRSGPTPPGGTLTSSFAHCTCKGCVGTSVRGGWPDPSHRRVPTAGSLEGDHQSRITPAPSRAVVRSPRSRRVARVRRGGRGFRVRFKSLPILSRFGSGRPRAASVQPPAGRAGSGGRRDDPWHRQRSLQRAATRTRHA